MKLSYALMAAATRGSAGDELLLEDGVVAGLVFGDVELSDVPVVVILLSGALGPGFGVLLVHPARAATIAAAPSTTHRDPRTLPSVRG
jgi:hypothetical protein